MNATPTWLVEEPPDELTAGAWEFVDLLHKAGWAPSGELVEWLAAREVGRVVLG